MIDRQGLLSNIILIITLLLILSSIFSRFQYIYVPPALLMNDGVENYVFLVVREVCWFFLGLISLYLILKNRIKLIFLCFILLLISFLILRDLISNNVDNVFYGLRMIYIFLSFFSISYMCKNLNKRNIELYVGGLLKILILISIPIVYYQLKNYPGTFGETMFGPRVNGFYMNPIIFSMFLSASSVLFYALRVNNYLFWMALCLVLSMFTGGRTGILINILLIFIPFIKFIINKKIYLISIILAIAPFLFVLVSSSNISGRDATQSNSFRDGRLEVWSTWFEKLFLTTDNFLFGLSVGSGTNASVRFSGGDFTDSIFVTIFASFGFLGLLIFFLFIIYYLFKLNSISFICLIISLFFGIAQNLPELNPINIMMVLAIVFSYMEQKRYQI